MPILEYSHTQHTSCQHTHHVNTHRFEDRPRRSDGEVGWWNTSGNIGNPPLARVNGVGHAK